MDSLLVVTAVGSASLVFYVVLLAFIWSLRPRRERDVESSAESVH